MPSGNGPPRRRPPRRSRRELASGRFARVPGVPWNSPFLRRKPRSARRAIVQQPWRLPMAAQHLAAVAIQSAARGMVARLRRARGTLAAPSQPRPRSAPLLKKFMANAKRVQARMATMQQARGALAEAAEPFVSGGYTLVYVDFCAMRIQAAWRMVRVRRRYRLQRFAVYQLAAMQIQFVWKGRRLRARGAGQLGKEAERDALARRVQRAWLAFAQRRIFHYYRDLVSFRNAGDPQLMLKSINPREAALVDPAAGVHVRFRLAGESFPPAIVYKIYTHQALCDVNAFAPRDYTSVRDITPAQRHNLGEMGTLGVDDGRPRFGRIRVGGTYFDTVVDDVGAGMQHWYHRVENNGWRPVNIKTLEEAEEIAAAPVAPAAAAGSAFHYSRLVRREQQLMRRKNRKRKWLKQLYAEGLAAERGGGGDNNQQAEIDFESEFWEEDADELFQWSAQLDFEAYLEDWQQVGTTAASEVQ